MPFTAKLQNSDRVVSILAPDDVDAIGNPHALFECKACATEMRIRKGTLSLVDGSARRSHFFHMPVQSERPCAMAAYAAGESEDHRKLKAMFAADLAGFIPALKTDPPTVVELERWLPDCGRIADVYFETRSRHRAALEIQLSPLPAETLELRSRAYLDAEITPIWAFVEGNLSDVQARVLDRLGLDRLVLGLVRNRTPAP